MPMRNVMLTAYHQSVIEALAGSGRYQNASEVLREGLRLVEVREAREAAQLEALQEAARVGFADLGAGRYEELESIDVSPIICTSCQNVFCPGRQGVGQKSRAHSACIWP